MVRLLLVSFGLLSLTGAGPATATEPQVGSARVTYVTGSSVYVDAGRDDGLAPGDRLEVVRDGASIAVLEVKDLSSNRASCVVVEGDVTVEVGDAVRLPRAPAKAQAPAAVAPSSPAATDSAGSRRDTRHRGNRRIRGRAGLRYLWVRNRNEDHRTYSQPAVDLRLDGRDLAGGTLDLAVDIRARRTYVTRDATARESQGRSRVYRTSMTLHDRRDRYRVTAGRQLSRALTATGIFDGLSFDVDRGRWSFGAVSGTQPDPVDFSYSSDVREHGIFAQVGSGNAARRRWLVTAGLIGSYGDGVDREFLYLQGLYSGPKLSVYAAEEVDYRDNDFRSKQPAPGSDLSLTGSMINLRYRLGRGFALRAGYDSRRSVRLYRDVITPVTDLEDRLRRGIWVGVSQTLRGRYTWGIDVKTRSGGSAGTADSANLRFGLVGIGRLNLGIDSRATYYTNDLAEGWLLSLGSGIDLGRSVRLGATAGVRDDSDLAHPQFGDQVLWYGLDLDVNLGRAWYGRLSLERNDGDFESTDQAYLSVTYRF